MTYSIRPAKLCLALAVSMPMAGASALAQAPNLAASPADDFMRRQAGHNLQQRLDALEEATPRGGPSVRPEQTGSEAVAFLARASQSAMSMSKV